MVISCFIPFSFHNYLVTSTVTYSLKIYTPDTNVENLLIARVQLVGEEFMETERKTMIDSANRPETETLGYVKYYLETVFYQRERR